VALFITFEGVEGSGKTSQIRRLKNYLNRRGIPCVTTREPGGTAIGEKIRKILLHRDHRRMAPLSELFLYEAARAQHVREVIKPLLKKSGVILCDRYADASVAYQGHGRKLSPALVEMLNRIGTEGIRPTVTFLLDCPSGLGLKRARRRNWRNKRTKQDRFEREKIQFHQRVRAGYRSLARSEPDRVKVIDTRQGEKKVFEEIRKIVEGMIRSRRSRVQEVKGPRGPGFKGLQNRGCKGRRVQGFNP
jgi:dTMP kinase